MATLSVVALDGAGDPVAAAPVRIWASDKDSRPVAAYTDAGVLIRPVEVETADDGTVDVDLTPTADVRPTGAYYTVRIGTTNHVIAKDADDGQTVEDALVEDPSALGGAAAEAAAVVAASAAASAAATSAALTDHLAAGSIRHHADDIATDAPDGATVEEVLLDWVSTKATVAYVDAEVATLDARIDGLTSQLARNYRGNVFVEDDILGEELNPSLWGPAFVVTTGAVAVNQTSAPAGRHGVAVLSTGASADGAVLVGNSGVAVSMDAGYLLDWAARFTIGTASTRVAMGMVGGILTDGAWVGFDPADANWHLYTVVGGVQTKEDLGIAVTIGEWRTWRILGLAGTVYVYSAADDDAIALVTSTAAGLPASDVDLKPMFYVGKTAGTTNRTLDLDWVQLLGGATR